MHVHGQVCVLFAFLATFAFCSFGPFSFLISAISIQIATNPCAHRNIRTSISPNHYSKTQALLGTYAHTDICTTEVLENGKRMPVILPAFHTPGQR